MLCCVYDMSLHSLTLKTQVFPWLLWPCHIKIPGNLFCRITLSLVVWSFLMTQCWLWASERNIKEAMLYSPHCIRPGGPRFWFVPLPVMSILITWLKWYLSVLSTMKSFFFLSVINTFLWERNLRLCKYPVPYQTLHFFISFYHYVLMESYFIQWVITHYYHYLFWCSNCPRYGQWELPQAGSWVLLAPPFGFFGHKMSRFISYFHCPSMEIFQSCKELWFLIEIKMLSMLFATGVVLLPSPSSEQS